MDQNFEQRDLGKNTANDIPMRETDGREKSKQMLPVRFYILPSR